MIKIWLLCLCNWNTLLVILGVFINSSYMFVGRTLEDCFILVTFSLWMNLLYIKTCVQVLMSTDCSVYAMPSNANCNIEHLCVTVLIFVVQLFQWFTNKSFLWWGFFFQHVYTPSECKSLITRNSSQLFCWCVHTNSNWLENKFFLA